VDLHDRLVLDATFGDRCLEPDEALVLVSLAMIGMAHPQVHAFANWAVNPSSPNSFLRRCSIVTIMFNHYGVTGFGCLLDMLNALGLITADSRTWEAVTSTVAHHPPEHSRVRDLMPHSKFVDFTVKTRNIFMNKFTQYQSDFPGLDGEAFFLSSVFHSIDHTGWLLAQNSLDLQCSSPEFRADLELLLLAHVGLTDRLWSVPFYDFRCKAAPHPLFRETYVAAAKINQALADEMECCVCR